MDIFSLEGAAKEQFEKMIRDACCLPTTWGNFSGGDIKEDKNSILLTLTKVEFQRRMLQEEDGIELLALLEMGESNIVERMGLCHSYLKDGNVFFDVPGWNNLVAHLRIVNSV